MFNARLSLSEIVFWVKLLMQFLKNFYSFLLIEHNTCNSHRCNSEIFYQSLFYSLGIFLSIWNMLNPTYTTSPKKIDWLNPTNYVFFLCHGKDSQSVIRLIPRIDQTILSSDKQYGFRWKLL